MDQSYCDRETCPYYIENDGSSQNLEYREGIDKYTQIPSNQDISSSSIQNNVNKSSVPMANKATQISSEISAISSGETILPASEYELFYDCSKEKHNQRKNSKIVRVDMNDICKHMDNPKLFRDNLRQLTLLIQNLLKYIKQQDKSSKRKVKPREPTKTSLDKHKDLSKILHTEVKAKDFPHKPEVLSKVSAAKRETYEFLNRHNGNRIAISSSLEPLHLNVPLKINIKTFLKEVKPRDFRNCTHPVCSAIAKAAKPYLNRCYFTQKESSRKTTSKSSSPKSIDVQSGQALPIISNYNSNEIQQSFEQLFKDGNMPPCWCLLKNPAEFESLPKCKSKNLQKVCISSPENDFLPPCWGSLMNAKENKLECCFKCGVNPENCICEQLGKIIKLIQDTNFTKLEQNSCEQELTTPTSLPPFTSDFSTPPTPPSIPLNDYEPCDDKLTLKELEDLIRKTKVENNLKCSCNLKKPPLPPKPTSTSGNFVISKPCGDKMTLKELKELIKISKLENKLKCSCGSKESPLPPPVPPPKPPRKVYRLAFPQHKDLDICTKCRFEPSPLIDPFGEVFCPGSCGCCLCPWKSNATSSLEDSLRQSQIKVCKCRERTGSTCSQISCFDICPCREKAEAKHIELYGFEISKEIFRGEEVLLTDVKELMPAENESTRYLETPKKSSQTHFNRNYKNINTHQDKLYPSNTSQTSQLESTLYAELFNYSTMAAHTATSPHLCSKCRQRIEIIHQTTTSSSLHILHKPDKCTCHQFETSSSSESSVSEKLPTQLKLNFKPKESVPLQTQPIRQQQPILVPNILPRPERLQPYPPVIPSQQFLTPNSSTITDDYYSCNSEESAKESSESNSNAEVVFQNFEKGAEENLVVLQLLHEVVHFMNEDDPIRIEQIDPTNQDLNPILNDTATQTKEVVCVPLSQSQSSITQTLPRTPSKSTIKESDSEDDIDRSLPPPPPQIELPPWIETESFSKAQIKQNDSKQVGKEQLNDGFTPGQQPPQISLSTWTQTTSQTICKTEIKESDLNEDCKEPPNNAFTPGQIFPTPQLTFPPWTPCYCYLHGMAAAHGQTIPFSIPYNIVQSQNISMNYPVDGDPATPNNSVTTFPDKAESSQFLVYQESNEIYYECLTKPETDKQMTSEIYIKKYSENQEKPQDSLTCICPNPADICPMHGPIENIFKEPSLTCQDHGVCELKAPTRVFSTEKEEFSKHDGEIETNNASIVKGLIEDYNFVKNRSSDIYENYKTSPDFKNLVDKEHSKSITSSNHDMDQDLHPFSNEINQKPVSYPEPVDYYEQEIAANDEKLPSIQPSEVVNNQDNDIKGSLQLQQEVHLVEEMEKSSITERTSITTVKRRNSDEIEKDEYFKQIHRYELEEIDSADDYYYPDNECEELDEECELAKEKIAERRKKKNRFRDFEDDNKHKNKALATMQQLNHSGSPEEMKFFIDSLILDLDAMEHARRKSAIGKNICMPKPGICSRESFPVTITEVTDLGTTSLYVKWMIHDCCGIGGYEIYTDGYLTNRYFHCKHEAAVITNVDVTLPHKIALVALASTDDGCMELMCNRDISKTKLKCLTWKSKLYKDCKTNSATNSSFWTPSIYLYDPATCRAKAAPRLMRGGI